jgi:hypothetical protein
VIAIADGPEADGDTDALAACAVDDAATLSAAGPGGDAAAGSAFFEHAAGANVKIASVTTRSDVRMTAARYSRPARPSTHFSDRSSETADQGSP